MKRTMAKLEVKAETIRALSNHQLQQVAGATVYDCGYVAATGGCVSQTVPLCGSVIGISPVIYPAK
jgi:hypothetical protein